MRSKNHVTYTLIAVLLVISLACGISFNDENNSEEEIRYELTRQSIQLTQTAMAAPHSEDAALAESDSNGAESADEDTTEDDGTDDAEESDDTCYVSKFVSETIPDGSIYPAGDTFTKKWVIRNNGTCDWTTGYRFVFEEGDRMNGASSMNLDHKVSPGETYTFEVDLTAPAADGNYTGVWRLKAEDGTKLGKYWVMITVGVPGPAPASFAVTSVSFYMPHTSVDMACPGDLSVSAQVTTSAGGVVGVKWEDSITSGLPTKSWTFAGAESKIMNHTVTGISATGDYWAKLYIDAPNHQWFGPINFHVNCTP